MLRIAGTLAVTIVALLIFGKYFGYLEGRDFTRSMTFPLLYLPLLLAAFISYLIVFVISVLRWIRRRATFEVPLIVAALPAFFFLALQVPTPSFADGLREAVEEQLDRERLIDFAKEARRMAVAREPESGRAMFSGIPHHDDEGFQDLKALYPEALELSDLPPRVDVSADIIYVYYGSALVKHWGYVISTEDRCPYDRLSPDACQKVYDNIWVYSDIY